MAKKVDKSSGKREPATIQNRRASFDYHVSETFEAGMVLLGSEAKSIFAGRANLTDAYIVIRNNEAWIINFDVEPYKFTTIAPPDRRRDRKLLLHRKEISEMDRKSLSKGFTLVPLRVYFVRGRAKVLIGLALGKKQYDKRQTIAEREQKRETDRHRRQIMD